MLIYIHLMVHRLYLTCLMNFIFRASNTKLDKIMKELDEEVSEQKQTVNN